VARILIDGYNLLPQTEFKDRDRFIRALGTYARSKAHQITVVFDGTQQGTFHGDRYREAGIEVVFTPITVTADDMIEEILERADPNRWIVVSSDRRIQSAAKRAHSESVPSDEFARRMIASRAHSGSAEIPPWMEGREEDDPRPPSKKGPSRRLSRDEKRKRQTLKKLTPFLVLFLFACAPALRQGKLIVPSQRSEREAIGKKYAISTQGNAATQAAEKMFSLGGNAVDAVVAASFVISVERPQSTGLGGGGFLLFYQAHDQTTHAYDFRETAPRRATERMFLNAKSEVIPDLSTEGILSSAVPGLVAGLIEVHDKFGKLTRRQVLAPAIEIAEKGFAIYPTLGKNLSEEKELLARSRSAKKIFFNPDDTPLREGQILKQPDLAKTLRAIELAGRFGFYRGWVARALIDEHRRNKGLMTYADLERYSVKIRTPLRGNFKEFEIVSMPPPSSGGVHILEILNILERDDLKTLGSQSPQSIHLTASAMQRAFADRATYLGDPDFVKVPFAGLTSKKYAETIRKQIPIDRAVPSESVAAGDPSIYESNETTHISIIDAEGNVVSTTQTINGHFGSGIVAEGTGVLLNNEMDDFATKPGASNLYGAIGGAPNSIVPGKRPLSSMSPTIVLKNGTPVLALGSPNGTKIISCLTLTLLNYLEYGLPLYDSIATLRYHHQWKPDELLVENPSFEKSTARALEKMGHHIVVKDIGCRVQAVSREGELLHAVADPRYEGLAVAQ
jgi:gamma-glutamyltranspeptidase / glutathione hydrolase